ncbi:GNAT family N-acetyltransferase [Ruegeria marina]|uniref:Acetyltransferase (GNAT) domain-containing protein n=1 Tax=Ruegeria marina TaxID=639004 RepID=A0A1G6JPJ6_9RHOB|nr:GNAT family N-acetyltransferase [Ruegeria marina]SDC20617.1 Acetyltransferase (GNAT) domain-containing protein [Ruegeria marina]
MFEPTAPDAPPLQQSAEFAAALALCGQPPARLDDGALVLTRRLAAVPVALLSRARTDPGALPDLLARAGLRRSVILMNPDAPCPSLERLGAVPLITPAHVAELDLTGDLMAGLHPKWRNRLRHARRQGLHVSHGDLPHDPAHWLLTAEAAQQRARGYRNWPTALTLAYAGANPGATQLFTAHQGNTPIASLLILRHGTAASYHIGHSTPAGRATSAQTLLMWQAMAWLALQGVTRLDLGPVETEGNPGLARFKLGTGARLRPLGGTWAWWPPLGQTLRPLARLDRSAMHPGWTDSPAPDY